MSFPRLLIWIGILLPSWSFAWGADFKAEPVPLPNGKILVAPHADSVVLVSRLWLICQGEKEDLILNGQPLTWNKRFEGNIHVADLRLEIGMQRLKIGDEEVRFVLGRNDVDHSGPAEWQVYRLHNMKPGPNPCRECHECEKVEDKIHVGALNPPDQACFRCHERDDIQEQHANTRLEADWMESCSGCHFVHASPHKYLLRQPREQYLK